jgi:hypothetical protein
MRTSLSLHTGAYFVREGASFAKAEGCMQQQQLIATNPHKSQYILSLSTNCGGLPTLSLSLLVCVTTYQPSMLHDAEFGDGCE